LLSVSLTFVQVRVAMGVVLAPGIGRPLAIAFVVFGLQAGLAVGSGKNAVGNRNSIGAQELVPA